MRCQCLSAYLGFRTQSWGLSLLELRYVFYQLYAISYLVTFGAFEMKDPILGFEFIRTVICLLSALCDKLLGDFQCI